MGAHGPERPSPSVVEDPALARLQERVRAAAADRTPLRIRGGGTKDFYGESLAGDLLDVSDCCGIVAYAPGELVVTARAGTQLVELERELDAQGQMLAFEPPRHGAGATLGGVIATGFSGPRRPHAGAARDFVLGVRIVDGVGDALAFGGQVIKNVAGFDVSRLMTGALGTLGVLTEVSLKCMPKPRIEATRTLDCSGTEALQRVNEWGGKPLPISATCFRAGRLTIRLSGAPAAIASATSVIGGEPVDGAAFWQDLRDQALDFFAPALAGDAALWRLSVPSTTPWTNLPGEQLIEWGGALRWVVAGAAAAPTLRAWASRHGGHATLFRGGDKTSGVFQPLSETIVALHRRLKQVFDPHDVLNRGRMSLAF